MEFDIGTDIMNSDFDAKSGSISIQVGDIITKKTTYQEVEMWQYTGFVSRPAKAEPGKDAAQGIFLNLIDQNICLATRDIRDQKIYGTLDYGETAIYAAGPKNSGTAVSLYKDDGSTGSIKHLVKKGNSNSGAEVFISLSTSADIILQNDKCSNKMDPSGNITLEGLKFSSKTDSVELGKSASDFAALASKVDQNFTALVAAITAASDSTKAPITFAAPPLPSVASSVVKVSP